MDFTVDPQDAYEGVSPNALFRACGALPTFAHSVWFSDPESLEEACDMLMECYGMMGPGFSEDAWGTVDEEGVYTSKYEEDPQLSPFVEFELTDTLKFYVYEHAIVAVRDTDSGESRMTRMD
jgi:hypothetical protein